MSIAIARYIFLDFFCSRSQPSVSHFVAAKSRSIFFVSFKELVALLSFPRDWVSWVLHIHPVRPVRGVIGSASLGSVMGSLLGGMIGGSLGWKWVFWIPALLSALATCVAAFSTSSFPLWKSHTKSNSVDWPGAVLISTGLLLLLIAISEGPEIGWKTPWVIALIVLSAVFIASFTIWQRYLEKGCSQVPLLRVSMFQNGEFSALFLLVGCFYGSFNSFLIFATDLWVSFQLQPLKSNLMFIFQLSGLPQAK